jgi:hypothetical protein
MNRETASLLSLGEVDPELAEKIRIDIERIVVSYLQRNMYEISQNIVAHQQNQIERLALRGLKQHLNSASNIY